jgi:hypothetical protein
MKSKCGAGDCSHAIRPAPSCGLFVGGEKWITESVYGLTKHMVDELYGKSFME